VTPRVQSASEAGVDVLAEHLGGAVPSNELWQFIEVSILERLERLAESGAKQADVDYNPVRVELESPYLDAHFIGCTVEPLGRPERFSAQAVSDHHVVRDAD
jgi:hypothetical protein